MLCNYCGQAPAHIINLEGTGACIQCAQAFNTCRICLNSINCPFETDPSPIPKQVQQTICKGNMVAQAIVRNPEREVAFCHSCPCWNIEGAYCNRECGVCGNYNEFIPSPNLDE